ncbi:hypothetical protein ACQ86N_03460 [Puia sp. P3]|uniref:hypothetical protein n=1 Tax=Puia sp. P3 TaxID=3423952 RepID=UPI003D66ABFA
MKFIINNPIEQQFHRYNSEGGDLIYTLSVDGITSISLTIQPQCSVFVKNLVVREMNTDSYTVKDKEANVFEITLPQLSYGFISCQRLEGVYTKILDKDRVVWKGKEFVKAK